MRGGGVHLRSDGQRRRADQLQPVPPHALGLGEEAVQVVDREVQGFRAQPVFPNHLHHPADEDGAHVSGDLRVVLQEARPWPEPHLGLEMCSQCRQACTRGRYRHTSLSLMCR